jgi:hypothetical protein
MKILHRNHHSPNKAPIDGEFIIVCTSRELALLRDAIDHILEEPLPAGKTINGIEMSGAMSDALIGNMYE